MPLLVPLVVLPLLAVVFYATGLGPLALVVPALAAPVLCRGRQTPRAPFVIVSLASVLVSLAACVLLVLALVSNPSWG